MESPVILQVVGYQNSGKTTVITKLIKRLKEHQILTGVIKHHGHNDRLDLNDSGKDTERHRTAGASITSVISAKNSIMSLDTELSIEQLIEIYTVLKMDCIIIEGYKNIQYPRAVLLRNKEGDIDLFNQSETVIALIHENDRKVSTHPPQFKWNEEKWLDFLVQYILNGYKERKGS